MRYRTHKTETISEIGFGCYALSGVYGKKDPQRFIGLLRRAYELGVTFFDTADQYGPAEGILGLAIAPFRDRVWIATKVGAGNDGGFNLSAEHVLSSCEQSLQRLQTDWIDLYQVHFNDPHTPVEETLQALERLKADGKIRHYGVGHLPPSRIEQYLVKGQIFSTLVELSAAARDARERVLPLCRAYNAGVIAFSVTGRGLLTGKIGPGHVFEDGDLRHIDPLFQRERFVSGLRVFERLQTLAVKYGKTPVQIAIAWVLAQPGVVCALTGPSTIPHLEENLGGTGWSILPEDLAELERFFRDEDEWLRQKQTQSIRTILEEELDPTGGFTDLIYAIENLLELELATEKEILPFFQSLWPLRKQHDIAVLQQLQAVQAELRQTFKLALVTRDLPLSSEKVQRALLI